MPRSLLPINFGISAIWNAVTAVLIQSEGPAMKLASSMRS
ncbi:unnamed protein product [Penicillium roqueforti FM164]|uniref:Genomic scaffold, ProqFM164S03 n=1 Tax=Penicillium roqueforti (strain FM164) TaxID=1365484 RepID=W6QBS3_PENRF|nr:unnamed protein product [Penicillium roqueforti FM164]